MLGKEGHGGTGVVITSEMKEAGGRILEDFYDAAPESAASVASSIFRVMSEGSPSRLGGDCDESPLPNWLADENHG